MIFLNFLVNLKKFRGKLLFQKNKSINGRFEKNLSRLASFSLLSTMLVNAITSGGDAFAQQHRFYRENIPLNVLGSYDDYFSKNNIGNHRADDLLKHYKRLSHLQNDEVTEVLKDLPYASRISDDDTKKEILSKLEKSDLGKRRKQKAYYESIFNDIDTHIKNDESISSKETFQVGRGRDRTEYTLPVETMRHVKYGNYNDKLAVHESGGHTLETLDILKYIRNKKLERDYNINPFIDEFIQNIPELLTSAYKVNKKENGIETYTFFDSSDGHAYSKSLFPKHWDINSTSLKNIAQSCIEGGKKINARGDSVLYIRKVNGVCVCTVVNSGDIKTIFPLEHQKPNMMKKFDTDLKKLVNNGMFYCIQDPNSISGTLNIPEQEVTSATVDIPLRSR